MVLEILVMFMKNIPSISSRSMDILTNNNLFSIEPGHYVEGKFGIRIENLYVTKNQIKVES